MINFEKRRLTTQLRNPLLNFTVDKQEIEFRKDPLTGRWCRININRIKRPRSGLGKNGAIKELIKLSKVNCPFCSKNIQKSTAKFVEFRERLKKGESVLFPNIYPYSVYHAVVVPTAKKHYFGLNEMSPKMLDDSLRNILKFFDLVYKSNPRFRYPSINLNFMPPAAASIVHPHFQVIMDDKPTLMTKLLIDNSLDYYRKYKKNFWLDLLKIEKKRKKRFIGKTGIFYWLADFAPIKNNQISGICENSSRITSLKTKEIKDLATGLSRIFKKLWNKKIRSLNMSIFSAPVDEDMDDYFLVNLKMISRPTLTKNYVSDMGIMEILQQESVVETLPEEVAKSLRAT